MKKITLVIVAVLAMAFFGFSNLSSKNLYKIRIGCSLLTPMHCMFGEVFSRTDILKKHGLDGEVTFFKHGSDQAKSCESDKIDATFSCEIPVIFHLLNCPDLRIVGTPGALGRIALIVSRQSNIFSVCDLKNKTILIHEGSSTTMIIRKWLYDSGLNADTDVRLIESGKDTIMEKLSNKEGDGIVSWDPWLEVFLKKYDLRIIKERPFWSVVVISEKYLQHFPEAVGRYKEALREALWWASNNKDKVIGWISERSGLEPDTVKNVLQLNKNWILSGYLKEDINISLALATGDIEILEECREYLLSKKEIPTNFDIKEKINTQVFKDK